MMSNRNHVRITRVALHAIRAEVAQNDTGLETGGALLGVVENDELTILHALGPGPDAVRTPVQFEKDYVFTVREVLRLREEGSLPHLSVRGDWHEHGVDGLSGGDENTLLSVSADVPGYVAIAVCGHDGNDIRAYAVVDGAIVQLEMVVIEDAAPGLDFARTRQLVDPELLRSKHVLIVGLGSGGSLVALLLSTTAVGSYTLADHDRLEPVNGPRHVGKHHHLGMLKTDVMMSEMRAKNPGIEVETIEVPYSPETRDLYRAAVSRSDLVVASSGNAAVNDPLAELCREFGVPIVVGGCFERAAGGLVFSYDPRNDDAACLNCLMERGVGIRPDTTEAAQHLVRDYGLTEDELHAQQGMFVDIAFVATLVAKVALVTVLRGQAHDLGELPGNLVVWDSRKLVARWASIERRDDCAVCNTEAWLAAQEVALEAEPECEAARSSETTDS